MENKLRIVHLENSEQDASAIANVLSKGNLIFDRLVIESRSEMAVALKQFLPDIILLNSFQTASELDEESLFVRDDSARIPVIVVTSEPVDELAEDWTLSGIDDYFSKDKLHRLPNAIRYALKKCRIENERLEYLNQLKINEKRYRALIENSVDAVVILDAAGKPSYVSPSVKNVLGYTDEEVMNMDIFTLAHPEDITEITNTLQRVMTQPGIPQKGHTGRMLHKDGSWRWIEAMITNLLHDPAINGIVDNFRDITDRKLAEDKTKHFNRLYAFISQINQAIVHASGEQTVFREACRIATEIGRFKAAWIGIINYENQTINHVANAGLQAGDIEFFTNRRFSPYSPAGRVVNTRTHFVSNDIPNDPVLQSWHAWAAERGYGSTIVLPIWKSGQIFGLFSLSASETGLFTNDEIVLMEEATGDISYAIDNFEKQKQKVQAEALLRHKEQRMHQAQAIAHLGSWEMDLSTGIGLLSDEACRIYGLSVNDNVHTHDYWLSFVHPDDVDYVMKMVEQANVTLEKSAYYHRIVRKDGTIRHLYSQTVFEFNEMDIPVGIYGVMHDVTEIKLAENLLRRSESSLNAIIENTDAYIYSLDREFRYVTFNQALRKTMQDLYGVEISAGFPVMEFLDTYQPEESEFWESAYTRALNGETLKFQKEFRKGSFYSVTYFSIHPIWENNAVIGLSCFVNDVTKEKHAADLIRFKANLLNTIGQAAIATDLNGIVNYWNKAAEQLYGWTAEEAFGMNVLALSPSHTSKVQALDIIHTVKQNKRWNGEVRLQKKDGSQFLAFLNDAPVYDQNQNIIGIIGISKDITEQKSNDWLLDKITSMARIGSYEADLEQNTLVWSPMTREIYEVESGYVPGIRTTRDFFTPGPARETILKAFNDIIEKIIPFDLEVEILTAKKNKRWIRIIGESEFVDGVCKRLYGSVQDIDRMKRTEMEITKLYEEKNSILQSIGDAFFAVDKNWVVNYWNKEAEAALECSRHTVMGESIEKVFSGENDGEFLHFFQKAAGENAIQHFESYYKKVDKWFDVNVYPSPNGLSVYLRDVTERIQSDIRLQQLNKSLRNYTHELILSNKGLEQFSYIVSHNLRAPVANIIGLAELLSEEGYSEADKKDFMKGLLTNVKRLDEVIFDMNTILQVKKEISEKSEKVDFQDLVDGIQESISSIIQKEQAQIITDFTEINHLRTIKSYLQSIFYNLILNAIKYHQPDIPPVISIKSGLKDGKLIISVQDNGLGIDLEKRESQVFGLYKRFHHHVEGKGMGLFMVKTQVEMLGGKIAVQSKVNYGTEFLLEFRYDDQIQA